MKTMRVYEVLYSVSDESPLSHAGPAGDGTFIARFRSRQAAEQFAARHAGPYGQEKATVDVTDAPRRIAQRWGLA